MQHRSLSRASGWRHASQAGFRLQILCAALAALGAGAQAQEAVPAPAASDGLKLDQVVLTGTSTQVSKMKQSLSVSSVDAEQMGKIGATNAAELLRAVPGLRSESSGGEGNANITVRGVPLSAGGSRYVQMQEDGLPVLLFGDISFGTADQFVRADYNVERLEVVRGGSASTLASNSPGGLINFISKTGKESGGSLGLSAGLGNRLWRVDADYGGSLGRGTSFHVGGYQRVGEGGRPTGMNVESGGQIKASITQQFDQGFIRLSLKALDDKTPSFMPVPVKVSGGQIQEIPGIDPRKAFFITPSLARDTTFNKDGGLTTSSTRDGLHVKSNAIGLEAGLDLGAGLRLDEKFRKSSNSGRFMALFPADNGNGTGNSGTAGSFTGTLFNTSLDDMGNTFNDVKLTKTIQSGAGKFNVVGGLFYGSQTVAQTWFWNQYRLSMDGNNAQVLDANGKPSTAPIAEGWTTWGGCCTRTYHVEYTQTSPYAALTWEQGPVNLDFSLRRDEQKASGYTLSGDNANKRWDAASQKTINYKVAHTSYSLGGNYALDKDTSLFARASNGVSFSADRLLYGNPLDGSVPVALNEIDQQEAGVKWRGAGLSLFATLFNARTSESNYEVTTQKFTANKYKANGLELEAAYTMGELRLSGGATFTHATISASNDASTVGKTPRRQARLVWQLSPSYVMGPLEFGASLVGSGKSYGDDQNTITMRGYTVVNGFLSYQINPKTTVSLQANNLFNALAYTEIEGDGHAARALNGRSLRATLKFDF
ncbi:TonB-dependent receptor [Pelomonas sp. APW6]|uniref:TonB-dependent receptor n=1 Tax=Roseateles subflavus TaxID=3053353 RepID=A0ABT7LMX6_9BURK|nr:TonB-dependent receptor [Pelomonas sp. APW6]MDL5034223.1 TonB-dependent receptor [Pelomonas sp. APW6]